MVNKNKKSFFLLFITTIYLIFNLIVNYVRLNKYLMIFLILFGVISSFFYTTEYLNWKKRLLTFGISMLLEVGIHLFSAFLFESNLVFPMRESLFWGKYNLVILYSMMSVLIIQNTLNYIFFSAKKHSK